MARLACETKKGFYPTDTNTIKEIISKTINFAEEKKTFALDCCAGSGEAIEFIGNEFNCETYAVELDENRAIEASNRAITKVLNADSLYGVRKNNYWAGLNFLNPPYDLDSNNERLEIKFIQRWGQSTSVGGAMVLVINPSAITDELIKTIRVQGYNPKFSFYDPNNEDYKNFGQFFMILKRELPNFRSSEAKFMNMLEKPQDINSAVDLEKISIRTGGKPSLFKEIFFPRWKIENALKTSSVKDKFFQSLSKVSKYDNSIEQPNEGQSAILIASGSLDGEIELDDGKRIILKGTSTKLNVEHAKTNEENVVTHVKVSEHFKTVIYGLDLSEGTFVKFE